MSSVRGGVSPDFRLTIDDLVVSHDTVWARMRATGTDTGGHFGRPPTGRTFDIQVIDICRFERGVMVEHWGCRTGWRSSINSASPADAHRPSQGATLHTAFDG